MAAPLCFDLRPLGVAGVTGRRPRVSTCALSRPAVPHRAASRDVRARAEVEAENLSGEWPVNWSLASYEDVGAFFDGQLFKDDTSPGTKLGDIMSTDIAHATPEQTLDSVAELFGKVTGLPVVRGKGDLTLVGVISKKASFFVPHCFARLSSFPFLDGFFPVLPGS
jgi:CBS domain-containing protein